MGDALVLAIAFVCLGTGLAVAMYKRQRVLQAPEPPPRTWKSTSVTPVSMGPRNRVAERVARPSVMTQAILLAVEMARADDQVDEEERVAIHEFILRNVTGADELFSTQVMGDALKIEPSHDAVDDAIETIRAIASDEQKALIIQLLVAVAQADGHIHDDELAFMLKIGDRLGLSEETIRDRITIETTRDGPGPDLEREIREAGGEQPEDEPET